MAERAEEVLRKAVEWLRAAGIESAALDARLLLQAIAQVSHADILAGRVPPLSADVPARFAAAIARRTAHEPVHRILGRREFYGLELALSPDTLEPRPDTEALVDLVLPFIKKAAAAKQLQPQRAASDAAGGEITLLDIGTGSGAIALALLAQVPQLRAVGTDISAGACAAAQANAEALGLAARFQAVQSDGFSAFTAGQNAHSAGQQPVRQMSKAAAKQAASPRASHVANRQASESPASLAGRPAGGAAESLTGWPAEQMRGRRSELAGRREQQAGHLPRQYDFIVSNPPYIPHEDIASLSEEVRLYDPLRALDGGADGLDFYRLLAVKSAAHLKPGGYIAVEIGIGQSEQVSALFAAAGFCLIEARRDLGGIERALLFSRSA